MRSTPGMTEPTKSPQRAEKQPRRADPGEGYVWKLTDHCCRACFGRVLVRETFDRRRIYRCSNCGVEAEGRTEAAICACGLKLKTGVDAGIRCGVNENRTPEWPSEVTCSQVEPPSVN